MAKMRLLTMKVRCARVVGRRFRIVHRVIRVRIPQDHYVLRGDQYETETYRDKRHLQDFF
jgi:hypothetical protein